MTEEQTRERITKILVDQLGVRADQVTDNALLVPAHNSRGERIESDTPDLGCDSLDVVELVMAFEEEFRIEIPDDAAEKLNEATVAELITTIHELLQPVDL